MLFTNDVHAGLADGSITLTFRTWVRPQAKVGGRYRTGGLLLEVCSVNQVELRTISDADARRAGHASAQELRSRFEQQEHDGRVWRVEFRCIGQDDRIARRNESSPDSGRLANIGVRLERMDKASNTGPWTRKTLQLIAAHPGVVSTTLARQMKMERAPFKINVRKLKELGLTESLEIGYRLSPLGNAFMESERSDR